MYAYALNYIMTQFVAGMLDVSKDPDYNSVYDKMPQEPSNDPEMHEERRFFMSHADDLSMQMTVLQVRFE